MDMLATSRTHHSGFSRGRKARSVGRLSVTVTRTAATISHTVWFNVFRDP
jgi:hypothetical protein